MSKMKQYIDLMTPLEAYQKGGYAGMSNNDEGWCDGYDKGYKKGQEDVCTVSVSDILEKGELAGRKEVVEWLLSEGGFPWSMDEYPERIKLWQAQLKKWGIDGK